MPKRLSIALAAFFSIATVLAAVMSAGAEAPANTHFQNTWERTDKPVADAVVSRTWMWGPEAFTGPLTEPYSSSPGGQRTVQYYDKSRMEISHPNADPASVWYVTNGLLVMEMMTGYLQTGDEIGTQYDPAEINVAGDADDATGPTYATFGSVREEFALDDGATVTFRIDREGNLTNQPSLADFGVTAAQYVEATDHQVASPFWEFMNAVGTVYEGSSFVEAPLFQNPYYATGLPVTEAYWASVKIGGEYADVLVQCFERRCLTYNPANAPEWRVEAGNVGRHYYHWRYEVVEAGGETPEPTASATDEPSPTATASPTSEPTQTATAEPSATATIPNAGQVQAALEASANELVSCLSNLFTPDTLLALVAGETDAISNAIDACLSNSLPSALADALSPLVDRGVVCASEAMADLSIDDLYILANGTPDQQQALIEEIASETIDCLIDGL
ncbi:MAG: hypothetical protein R3A46_13885 [Thermomicrobiales bacterium]